MNIGKGEEEVLAIPRRIESELGKAIVQRGLGIHDRSTGGDNVQILELKTMVRVSKEQRITLSHDGMGKILQELDHAKRQNQKRNGECL